MPQIHLGNRLLADLADVYAAAATGLFDGLQNAATTADTVSDLQDHLEWALMAAIGFGNTSADVLGRGDPFLVRTARDLIPTSGLLDTYSPSLFCSFRDNHDVEPKVAALDDAAGYSIRTNIEIVGAGIPYAYPDNLPRVSAHGGHERKPRMLAARHT